MYNEERKNKFFDWLTIDPVAFQLLFKMSEPHEEQLGKDMAEFDQQEFFQMLANGHFATYNSMRVLRYQINKYLSWCRDQGYQTTLDKLSGAPDLTEKIRYQMVGSPENLSERLNSVFKTAESQSVDCLYRVFVWLLYMGMDKEEVPFVKKSEVDLMSLRVTHNGVRYSIPSAALADFMITVNATEFLDPRSRSSKRIARQRIDSEYLTSGTRSEHLHFTSVQRVVNKARANSDDDIPPIPLARIRRSGMFWRAYCAEKHGGLPDLDPIIQSDFDRTTYAADPDHSDSLAYRRALKHKYIHQYAGWKKAFNLA